VISQDKTIDDASIKAAVQKWNRMATEAVALDHTPSQEGEGRVAYEQGGPTRTSRALAIAHIAMFDALNAVTGGFESYTRTPAAEAGTSAEAAIAQSMRDVLVALYPSQSDTFDVALEDDLASIPDGFMKDAGVSLGRDVAERILALREGDGSDTPVEYVFSDLPGAWRKDPMNPTQEPIGEEWFQVTPFVMNGTTQFRSPPPPDLDSAEYTAAFAEVQTVGGDGVNTPTTRTPEQTSIGMFWGYDGTSGMGTPPRLFNQIAMTIADDRGLGGADMARMLALINVAMADACIAVWDSKFHYNYWRPVTAIREADEGAGPTGLGDGNAATAGDPAFVPLGAPASNSSDNNFTPAFPAYPSGHAGFAGAVFQTLRTFYGTDDIQFTFMSDEMNGETKDNGGIIRPASPRRFMTLSQAEEECGQSRIYLGIHWTFDKTAGVAQGNRVADFVIEHAYQPAQ